MTDTLGRLADEIDSWAGVAARTHQRSDLERITAELRTERDRLHSWAGLMALLDKHYPSDVFGGDSGDLGPRVIGLIRECDALRHSARELKRIHDECHQQRDAAWAEVELLRVAPLIDRGDSKLIVICGSVVDEDWLADAALYVRNIKGALACIPRTEPGLTKVEHDRERRAWIGRADEVLAVRKPDGSVGESTAMEVEYALSRGVPVRWWPPEPPV